MPEATAIATQDPSKQVFKIKVKGQEKEVTQDELIRLAQQGDDYAQNTEALKKREETLKEQETRVMGLKAIVDEMEVNPKLKEVLNKVYSDFKSGKISESEDTKDRNLKLLDKRISEAADPEIREQLRDIREIIKQEAPVGEITSLKDEIKSLREELSIIKDTANLGQSDRIGSQIEKLKEDYGDDLVDKHKDAVKSLALKYPRQPVENLLLHLADKSEVRTALLNQAKKTEKEELERKRRGSSPSGTEGSFSAKTELKKDKAGRVTIESLKNRILERLGKK